MYNTDNQGAIQTLYEQLGRIQGAVAKPAETPQNAEDLARAARQSATGEAPDVPKTPLEQVPKNAGNPPLKGYKMEEETLFRSAENHPVKDDLDWETLLVLFSVFGLGFLVRRGRR